MKRKRDNSPSVDPRETPPTSGDENSDSKSVIIADNPFQVKILPLSDVSKLPKAQKNWTAGNIQRPVVSGAAECAYKIYPADRWESMRKYAKFVVGHKTFGVGDYIYIYHGENRHGTGLGAGIDPDNWVAQVLEIRAEDSAHVYLRVFWMYWPDELPGGRQDFHGAGEVVASNHMEIMDAMTVTDTADVLRLDEKGAFPKSELYWRLKLDVITGKTMGLKRGCYCNEYHNPEERLIQCPHCEKFLHEKCLLRDACSRAWFQEKSKTSGSDQHKRQEAALRNGTIPDSQKSNGTSSASSQSTLPPPPTPLKPVSHIKNKKQKMASLNDPWADHMRASIEMKDASGEETPDATGMATVTHDPINGASQQIKMGLRCLMAHCGKWLYDEPASHHGNGNGLGAATARSRQAS